MTLEVYSGLSDLVMAAYLVVAAWILFRARHKFSPVNVYLVFFFVYSFSYVLFVNRGLTGNDLGLADLEATMWGRFGLVTGEPVYLAFLDCALFGLAFLLGVAIVRPLGGSLPRSGTITIHYHLPRPVPLLAVLVTAAAWAALFLWFYGPYLQQGIGAYAAKSLIKSAGGAGYGMKLIKGFYSLWIAATIAGLAQSLVTRRDVWFFGANLAMTVLAGALMGDRSQMFVGLIAGIALFERLGGLDRARRRFVMAAIPLAVLATNALITFYRSMLSLGLLGMDWRTALGFNRILGNAVFSAESWAPFGGVVLMRTHEIDRLGWSAIAEIVTSFIPRFLMPSRSASGLSYMHYADEMGLSDLGQGFGLHVVADARMVGGGAFIALAGLVTGLALAGLTAMVSRKRCSLHAIVIYALAAGFVPNMMRSGLGSVRAFVVEFVLLAVLLLVVVPWIAGRRPVESGPKAQ